MPNDRIKKWENPRRLLAFLTGDNKDLIEKLTSSQKRAKSDDDAPDLSSFGIIETCKELIYNIKDGKPVFHAILYGFDVDKGELTLGHTFDILVNEDESEEEIEEDLINTLALAAGLDVPVYPNNKELEPELARLHRKLLIDGFTAPDGEGNRVKLQLTRSPGEMIDKASYLTSLDLSESISPADLSLIRKAVMEELSQLRNAENILSNLSYAIDGLTSLLDSKKRNENKLQSWLTENPILFGIDYQQIIPKHRLGSEYEMDYALKRHSGLIDLVEIESSCLQLFNKSGSPSQYLVHAEQQVLDWIEWIETNGSYAREKLSGTYTPKAFVIIGRSSDLREEDIIKLRRRNITYREQIEVLTFDDLLDRAKNIKEQLLKVGENV